MKFIPHSWVGKETDGGGEKVVGVSEKDGGSDSSH
jgi:hypothetical protein